MHTESQAQASLERLGGAQSLRNPFLAACQLHPLFLGLRQRGCFFKEWVHPIANRMAFSLQGPGRAPESPMPRVQAALSTQMAPSLTTWPEVPCTGCSGPLRCLPDEGAEDGWIAAGHLLCGKTKPRPLLRAGALGAREKAGGASGEVMGRVLAASQEHSTFLRRTASPSGWAASPQPASLRRGLCHAEAASHRCSLRCPSARQGGWCLRPLAHPSPPSSPAHRPAAPTCSPDALPGCL